MCGIVSGLQIVEPSLGVIIIPTITERIHRMSITATGSHLRRLNDIAPRIIRILVNLGAALVVDGNDIALQIRLQIIDGVCEISRAACTGKSADGNGLSGCIVIVADILHHRRRSGGRTANHLAVDLTANHVILMTDSVDNLDRADSLVVVLIRNRKSRGRIGNRGKLTTKFPLIGISSISQRVADLIIGERLAVVGGQTVSPSIFISVRIRDGGSRYTTCRIDIGIFLFGKNVACLIVRINHRAVRRITGPVIQIFSDQLALVVVPGIKTVIGFSSLPPPNIVLPMLGGG